MAQNNRINFQLNFKKGDTAVLQSLKNDIAEIQRMAGDIDFTAGMSISEINKMVTAARTLETALDQAFDVDLNTVNIQKFNQILKQSGYDAKTLQSDLSMAGATGQQAFLKMTSQLMQFNTVTKQTNQFLDNIATTLFNTIKWTVMSSIVNSIASTVQKSYGYVKSLDSALNDIRIVTGKSAEDMEHFAESANNAAKALAVTTGDYTEGSLIYYQQGLDDETVKTLTDITAKTSNVTGQAMSTVSEELTAVWNGYKVANQAAEEGMQIYEEYVDKMAAVGASTASNLEELSTAMSKVASAASNMGVGFDDLNAQIATIVSVTRQAPESVGTALKTIYARLGDLKVDGVDEFGTKLGEVSSQLQTMGINILDSNGDMRQMSEVITEVAQKLSVLTSAQKEAAAVAMAGKRQYNNLVALFENLDMYGEALETSMNAAGTLEKQQETALESLANKMDVLKATAEDLYDSLFDTDTIIGFVEAGTGVLQFFADFSDAIGGLNNLLPIFGSIGLQVFSEQIGRGLATIVINARNAVDATKMMIDNQNQLRAMFQDSSILNANLGDNEALKSYLNELLNYYQEMSQYQGIMSQEQKEQYNNILKMKETAGSLAVEVEEQKNSLLNASQISKTLQVNVDKFKTSTKEVNNIINETNSIMSAINTVLIDGAIEEDNFGKIFQNLNLEAGKTENLIKLIENEVKAANGNIDKGIENTIQKLQQSNNALTEILNKEGKIKSFADSSKILGDSLASGLNTQAVITNVMNVVGALGQLASAINMIHNLGDILANEDISHGEKILQTIINISFALPMITSSLSKLNKTFGSTNGLMASFELLSKRKAALSTLNAAGISLETKALKSKTEEELKDLAVEELIKKNQAELNGQRVVTIAGLTAEQKALILEDAEKKKLTVTTLALKNANDGLNASMLANPITIIIGLLVAAIAIYSKYTGELQEAAKAQKEACKADIESTKEKYKEVQANKEVYDSYMNIYELYKNNKATKEEISDVTKDLVDKYNIEINKLDELNGKYDEYTLKLKEARFQELNNIKQSLSETKNKAVDELQASSDLSKNIKKGKKEKQYNAIIKEGFTNLDSADKELYSYFNQRKDLFNNIDGKFTIDLDFSDPDKAIETYDKLVKFKEDLDNTTDYNTRTESEYYKNLKGIIEDLSESVEHYKEIQSDIYNIDAQIAVNNADFYNIKNLKEFLTTREELINSLEKETGSREKATELIDNYIEKENDASKSYLEQSEIASEIAIQTKQKVDDVITLLDSLPETKKQLILTGKVDLTTAFSKEAIEYEINKATKNLGTYEVSESVSLATTLASGNKLKKADNQALQALESDMPEAMAGFDEKGVNHQLEAIDEITQYRIDKNAEYLKDYEGTIQKEVDFTLKEKQKIFASDEQYYKAQKFYEEHKYELTEAARQEEEAKLTAYEALIDKQKELNDLKEEGLSFDDIEDIGFSSLLADLDMVVNKADLIKSAAELIGDGFTVAASDVEKFSNMFPELLEDMEVLADGSIKLDKEVLNEKLGNIQEEVQKRTEAKIIEIDQQIQLKEAEQTYLKEKLDALTGYLNGTKTQQESVDKIHKAGQEYQKTLMDITGQEISELTNFSIDSAGKEGTAYIQMLDQVGSAFAKAANAHYAMINGQQFDLGEGVSFSGITSSAEEFAFSAGQDAIDRLNENADLYNKVFEAAKEAQDQYNTVTGELDTLRKQRGILESSMKAAGHAVDNVKAGKSGKDAKSKSSKDKDKDKKEYEDEFDRYWEIKKVIDAVDRSISRLEKDQQNLHGKELIASLKQENELIKQQSANYEKLYEMQKQEAEELRAQLSIMGLAFDANGAITNYAAATSAALAQYTAAIEQYNAGLIDETTLKVFEKSYENFKKLLERYDKLYYTEMQDTQDKLDDMRRKELANNLKAWEVEIQLRLDTTKAQRDWNDFLKDIEQDFRKVYQDLTIDSSFDRDNFKEYMKDVNTTLKAIKDVEAEIEKMKNGGQSDMFESISQAQEKLKELQEQLIEQGKSLYELYKAIWNNYLDGMDQVKDKFDELMKRYKHLDNELKFQKELIELVYGDKAYDLMDKYYATQEKNIEAQINSLRQQTDFLQEQFNKSYELARKTGAEVDLDDWTTLTEDMQKAYDNMIQSQEDLNDLVLEGVKILQEKYLNSINKIMDAMDEGVLGKGGFDEMKSNLDFMQKKADAFLDDVQGAYKIQSLALKIDQEIAKTTSTKNQQKLQTLREHEIDMLREKKDLTQADIDLSEARLQIALKEMALEDARNNKTSMKLTRNEQGNLSYQYVADEDDVAAKEQDLNDAYGNLYELANNSYQNSMELVMDLYEEMKEKMIEIASDTTLTEEEKNQKLLEIQEQYRPLMEAAAGNAEIYRQEAMIATSAIFGNLCQQDETAYEKLTDLQKRLVDEFKAVAAGDYDTLRTGIIEGFYPDLKDIAEKVFGSTNVNSQTTAAQMIKTWSTNKDSVKQIILDAISKISIETEKYQKQLDQLQEIAGVDFKKIGEAIDAVDQKINDMNGDTEKLANDSDRYLDELRKLLEEIASALEEVSEKIQNARNDMEDYAEATRDAKAAEQQLNNPPSSPGSSNSNSGNNGDGDKDNPDTTSDTPSEKYGIMALDGHHSVDTRVDSAGKKGLTLNEAHSLYQSKLRTLLEEGFSNFRFLNLDKNAGFPAYKTGGYTGELADNSGRLAVLHQKELILNADDTKNFLEGIKTVRDLTAINGSISNAIAAAIGGMALSLAGINPGTGVSGAASAANNNTNTYNITAEFPNAYSAEEIKQAILTLPNYASQYVNRNAM